MAKGICEHCGGTFICIREHENTCIDNPEANERIKAFLHKHAVNGVIMSMNDYQKLSAQMDLPAHSRLTMAFGGWPPVAGHFGLKARKRRKTHECPTCQRLFTPNGLASHIHYCPKNTQVHKRLMAFVTEIAVDGHFPSLHAYVQASAKLQADVPSPTQLTRIYGGWGDVAQAIGFEPHVKVVIYDKDFVWDKLRQWFDEQEPPYMGLAWDEYARKNSALPSKRVILERWGITWADIQEEFETPCYAVRDDELLAANYRPPRKWTKEAKIAALKLVKNIEDERERKRRFWEILGIQPAFGD